MVLVLYFFFSSRRRHTRCALVTGVQTCALPISGMVETAVVQHIRSLLRTPEIAARAMEAARRTDPDMTEHDVVTALAGFDGLWESLFPAEQAQIGRAHV